MTESERLEKLKKVEDEVKKVLDSWNNLRKAITYKAIYNEGEIRVSTVDAIIKSELEKEK